MNEQKSALTGFEPQPPGCQSHNRNGGEFITREGMTCIQMSSLVFKCSACCQSNSLDMAQNSRKLQWHFRLDFYKNSLV